MIRRSVRIPVLGCINNCRTRRRRTESAGSRRNICRSSCRPCACNTELFSKFADCKRSQPLLPQALSLRRVVRLVASAIAQADAHNLARVPAHHRSESQRIAELHERRSYLNGSPHLERTLFSRTSVRLSKLNWVRNTAGHTQTRSECSLQLQPMQDWLPCFLSRQMRMQQHGAPWMFSSDMPVKKEVK
jgi:hypothetical protein